MATRGERFVRSRAAPLLVAGALARGVDIAPVLRQFGLPHDLPRQRFVDLPASMLRDLGDALARAARDESLGMRIGATLPRGTYGLLEFCIRHSGTVREGLWKLASYRALAGDVSAMRVEVCDAGARLVEHFPGDPLGPGRQVNEFTLALYVCTIREVIDEPSWAPREVYFMHAQPRNLAPLVELLGTRRLSFRQSGNGMLVSNAVLDRSLVGADAQLLGVLEEQVNKELVQQALVIDIQSALRTRVCEHLPRGNPKLETVASELRMSGRSLQRWLQERGLTFNHVVEDARRQLALAYLREPERTLGDIASSLGFSDLRAFSRAFRRWTSEPPGAWRKRHLTSSDLSCVSSKA